VGTHVYGGDECCRQPSSREVSTQIQTLASSKGKEKAKWRKKKGIFPQMKAEGRGPNIPGLHAHARGKRLHFAITTLSGKKRRERKEKYYSDACVFGREAPLVRPSWLTTLEKRALRILEKKKERREKSQANPEDSSKKKKIGTPASSPLPRRSRRSGKKKKKVDMLYLLCKPQSWPGRRRRKREVSPRPPLPPGGGVNGLFLCGG